MNTDRFLDFFIELNTFKVIRLEEEKENLYFEKQNNI